MTDYRIEYVRSIDDTSIAAARGGRGLPLVVVARFDECIETAWHQYADAFPDHELVMYDRRGSGLSDRHAAGTEPDRYVLDLRAVVEGLGLERFDLLGSLAGTVEAAALAAREPARVRRLVLRSPVMDLADWASLPPVRAALAALEHDWVYFTESFAQLVVGWGNPGAPAGARRLRDMTTREELQSLFAGLAEIDLAAALPAIAAPTLVVHLPGYFFPDSYSRRIASLIPDCRLAVFPAGGDFKTDFALSRDFLAGGPEAAAPARSGLQTILFTDLEASTELTQRRGDAGAQELVRGHNATVRNALRDHEGREVKHTGDGIMASFASAASAVAAALQIQRDLAGGEIRVRVGLNAGEPITEDDDLFGLAVIKAARISDHAEPGQVLVSRVVMDLCEGKPFAFTKVDEVRLKGFDEPVSLYAARGVERS